jgi:hypothetical protein
MYNIPTSQYSEKVQCEKAPGISDSIERLYKECNILQEQLAVFRDRLGPYLKKSTEGIPIPSLDIPKGASERTQALFDIAARIREMQFFIDCLNHDIDL